MANFIKCEKCGETYNGDDLNQCPSCKEKSKENDGTIIVESNLSFPLGFSGLGDVIFASFAKNGKIKFSLIFLISIVEIVVGVVVFLLAYSIASIGLEKSAGFVFLIAIPLIWHSFYSIVKYGTYFTLSKFNSTLSESKSRVTVWLMEILIGVVFIVISICLDYNDCKDDIVSSFIFIGIGQIIFAIISIYIFFKHKYNWKFPQIGE